MFDHRATTLGGGATQLRVMTYNVSWESFASARHMSHCLQSAGENKCVKNIARVIATYLPDVLCMQEIREDREWRVLQAELTQLVPDFAQLYAWVSADASFTRAGVMTVFNQRKFAPVVATQVISLNPSDPTDERPGLVVRLSNGLVVANVHVPHQSYEVRESQFYEPIFTMIATAVDTVVAASPPLAGVPSLLLCGDFNFDANRYLQSRRLPGRRLPGVLSTLFSSSGTLGTCCGPEEGDMTEPVDHIFTNISQFLIERATLAPETVEQMKEMKESTGKRRHTPLLLMSDHLPVIATMTLPANPMWRTVPVAQSRLHAPSLESIPDDALFLIHSTSNNPSTWGYLRMPFDDGVYTTLVTKSNFDLLALYQCYEDQRYIIQLPLNLLTFNNYHVNLFDMYGYLDAGLTYMPWELNQAIESIQKIISSSLGGRLDNYNEVVFKNDILIPKEERNISWRVFKAPGSKERLRDVKGMTKTRFVVPPSVAQRLFSWFVPPRPFFMKDLRGQRELTCSRPNLQKKLILDSKIPRQMTEAPLTLQHLYLNTVYQASASAPNPGMLNASPEWLEWDDFQKSLMFTDWRDRSVFAERLPSNVVKFGSASRKKTS